MFRRLFNNLQQCIERGNRKHMHFVDDVHTHLNLRGSINCIIAEITNIIHTVIGRCIDLQHIHTGTGINCKTGFAAITGITVLWVLTIYCLSQNFGAAGFTCSPRTGEQVRMTQTATLQLGFQRLRNRKLTHNIIKCLRSIFTIQRLIHTNLHKDRLITRSHTHI